MDSTVTNPKRWGLADNRSSVLDLYSTCFGPSTQLHVGIVIVESGGGGDGSVGCVVHDAHAMKMIFPCGNVNDKWRRIVLIQATIPSSL